MAKKTKTAGPVQTATFTAVEPITHDGERYEPGEEIVLAEQDAAPLLAVKAVELAVVQDVE